MYCTAFFMMKFCAFSADCTAPGRGRAAQVFHHDGQCLFQLMHLAGLKYIPHHTQADGRWAYSKSGNPLRIVTCMSGNSLRTAASSASPSAPGMQISVNRISGRFSRQHGLRRKPVGRGSRHFAAILRPGHHLYQAADDDILVVHDHHLIHPISPHCFCLWS